jgi:class 3 adenylate cyclase
MRNFASHSAHKTPENIALFINGVFHTMTEAALTEDGVPIKYVGDGFLAYFSGENHKTRALKAAIAITDAISEKGLLLTLNSGDVYLGAMGHHEYARPDIIGDSVNFAFIMNRWATDSSEARLVLSSSLKEEARELTVKLQERTDSELTEPVYEVKQ